jgi:outer membrane protein OmpA-like peptidoglycan-associated protein
VAATLAALVGSAAVPPATAQTRSAEPGAPTDLRTAVRDLVLPVPRDLIFEVVWLDGSVTDMETGPRVQVTLNADVFFAFDEADLTVPAAVALADLAPRIANQAKGTVRIEGYTDAKGTDAYNVELSQRRAEAVKADLSRRMGAKSVRFEAVGRGATEFVAPNTRPDGSDDPDGRARNRRVTVTYDR